MKAKLVPLSSTDNQQRFYRAVLEYLNEGGFHYLVGGGHALEQYAGPLRVSKDLDLFVRRADVRVFSDGSATKVSLLSCHSHIGSPRFLATGILSISFLAQVMGSALSMIAGSSIRSRARFSA